MKHTLTSPCKDCGTDTTPVHRNHKPVKGRWEWYMVNDALWAAAGMQTYSMRDRIDGILRHQFLCVACLEKRLGRQLRTADFNWELPINAMSLVPGDVGSPRLLARMITDLPLSVLGGVLAFL